LAEDKLAFVFPAFINDYREDPSRGLVAFNEVFQSYLKTAAECTDKKILDFHPESNPLIEDELLNQYISYIYSCSCAHVLLNEGVKPVMMAGYSMGIYAALYIAGSVTFETGLLLIQKAWEAISKTLPHSRYGMCGLIGLTEKDIREITMKHNLNLMIVNRNSDHSFILTGDSFHIRVFMLKAREEGALHVRSIGVTIPYHTNLLDEAAIEFSKTVFTADVHSPGIPLISVLSQDQLEGADRIREEVIKNIHTPFNWLATQQQMFLSGITHFTECGPSMTLYKNSKFIGDAGKFVKWDTLLKESN